MSAAGPHQFYKLKLNFMEKINLKHLGKEPFTTRHGDLKVEFAPGETREVSAHVAELLLTEVAVERKYKKNGGGVESEEVTPLFEVAAAVAEPVKTKKGESK